MAGLIKELWVAALMKAYQENPSWIYAASSLDSYLSSDGTVLNLAHAGADPAVFINNTVYPMTVNRLSETPSTVALDRFTTEPTLVYNYEKRQYSYDKIKEDALRHANAIKAAQGLRTAFNWSPASNAAGKPVIGTTGAATTGGRKRCKFEDLITLNTELDNAGIDPNDRHLVLCAAHKGDLMTENLQYFNSMVANGKIDGIQLNFAGIWQSNATPVYTAATGVKGALGAVEVAGTAYKASFVFQKSCVGFSNGKLDMFSNENDPLWGGTIQNYEQHFLGLPLRTYGYGAIYSKI